MSDNLSCPGCQAEYDATGYDPGDQFQCPSCQTIVTVPGGEGEEAAAPRMPKMKSRGTTRRTTASRPPMQRDRTTSKMRTVNEAVGMGMTMPGQDPRNARRAQAAPPPPDAGNKNMTWIFVGLGALMVVGGVIFLVKGAGSDEGKKKKKETAKVEEKAPKGTGTAENPVTPPVDPNPGGTPPVDLKEMSDAVTSVLNLLKGKPQDSVFWKVSAPLLKYGPAVIGELVERFVDDQEPALVARAIVVRAAGTKIPEEHFYSEAERQRIKADVWSWWRDAMAAGTIKLVSEADYLSGSGGSATKPPDTGNPPVKPPDGVGNPPKPVGGTGEKAIVRDLPQRLANYGRGTAEQRDTEMREIRGYGKPVIRHLLGHLSNEDYDLARAANSILQELTKQNHGNVPAEERKDFVKKWEDWWTANEATFTM